MVMEQFVDRGIVDLNVLDAFREVERERFVPKRQKGYAYSDRALPIGFGQTISQPFVVAYTLDLLDLKESDKLLEIGTGSGYLAAVTAEIVDFVVTIEIVPQLGERAKALLNELRYDNIKVIIGDGFIGYAELAPYDAIIVSAAAEQIPQPLIDQLAEGGRLIMPVGPTGGVQTLTRITKKGDQLIREELDPVRFVPLTREKN